MSNIFQRPNPEQATIDDVKKALDEITKWDWTTGYSFAHIVIDDFNLGDKDILYCLRPDWIAEVMNDRIVESVGRNFSSDEFLNEMNHHQLMLFMQPIEHMAEVIDLLHWLLAVPEEVRNEIG